MLNPIYTILILYGKILLAIVRYLHRQVDWDDWVGILAEPLDDMRELLVQAGDELMDAGVWETNEFRGEEL